MATGPPDPLHDPPGAVNQAGGGVGSALQTPSDIAVEHNSTIVFPLPIELLRMIKSTADTGG